MFHTHTHTGLCMCVITWSGVCLTEHAKKQLHSQLVYWPSGLLFSNLSPSHILFAASLAPHLTLSVSLGDKANLRPILPLGVNCSACAHIQQHTHYCISSTPLPLHSSSHFIFTFLPWASPRQQQLALMLTDLATYHYHLCNSSTMMLKPKAVAWNTVRNALKLCVS